MVAIWSPQAKIIAERRLWLAVLRRSGIRVDVPDQAVADYERVLEQVDLDSIAARERDAARRQGPHRGVQRAGRSRARPTRA